MQSRTARRSLIESTRFVEPRGGRRLAPPRKSSQAAVPVESLEARRLLAGQPFSVAEVAVSGGTELRVTGTNLGDSLDVYQTSQGLTLESGNWLETFAATYKRLLIDGLGGNDVITLDEVGSPGTELEFAL